MILVSMSESFAEITLMHDGQQKSQRFFLSKTSIANAIAEMISSSGCQSPEKILLTTQLSKTIFEKRLGNSPAFLVTSGFENWLDMTIPTKENYFSVELSRPSSPIDPDFIFGINERIDSEGKVLTPLETEELEFIAQKLKMNEINSIAIGFIHSDENSEHENKTKKFFEEQGFNVFASSESNIDYADKATHKTERQRWWNAIINAYIYDTLYESLKEVADELVDKLKEPCEFLVANMQGDFVSFNKITPLNTLFAKEHFLRKRIQQEYELDDGTKKKAVGVYFGLDQFHIFDLAESDYSLWQSELGMVGLDSPQFEKLKIQPTSIIEKGFWSCPSMSNKTLSWEPGPMCLGRGSQPTFFDLLSLELNLKDIAGFENLVKDKSKSRINEMLFAYSKNDLSQTSLSSAEVVEGLLDLSICSIGGQLNAFESNYLTFCGPLSEFIYPLIKKHLRGKQIKLIDEEFLSALSLLPGGKL